jgi:hypothetical protein
MDTGGRVTQGAVTEGVNSLVPKPQLGNAYIPLPSWSLGTSKEKIFKKINLLAPRKTKKPCRKNTAWLFYTERE